MPASDGRTCVRCRQFKEWPEFGWRTGPGKGRRAQCKECDEAHPVPGTPAEYIAARYPDGVPPLLADVIRDAFHAGRQSAYLGYGGHVPRQAA